MTISAVSVDLVTCTKEIINRILHFLDSEMHSSVDFEIEDMLLTI